MRVARRIHIPVLRIGEIPLDPIQAHHARDVLRLDSGTTIDVFDDAGATATGVLLHSDSDQVVVRVERIDSTANANGLQWIIAAAVPKGDRADWMVEKLSELGAAAFIPLAATRSVVLPEGRGKRDRWMRIATESAKQSRRIGVMRIEELTDLNVAINAVKGSAACFLATEVNGTPIGKAVTAARELRSLTLFVGPEGGWTEREIMAFTTAGISAVRLGSTILRIETAAVAAGAVVATTLA